MEEMSKVCYQILHMNAIKKKKKVVSPAAQRGTLLKFSCELQRNSAENTSFDYLVLRVFIQKVTSSGICSSLLSLRSQETKLVT